MREPSGWTGRSSSFAHPGTPTATASAWCTSTSAWCRPSRWPRTSSSAWTMPGGGSGSATTGAGWPDLPVDVDAPVWQLSVGQQQRVEIVKMLYRGVRLLILDEPTAALTPQEARALFATLRAMAAQGRAVVFISHKLDEVMSV